MRTNIDLDQDTVEWLLEDTGFKTKKELVNFALKELKRRRGQLKILELQGIVKDGGWDPEYDYKDGRRQ